MSVAIAIPPFVRPPAMLTGDQIAGLARTYDSVDAPVWVHDLTSHCLYRNEKAAHTSLRRCRVQVFDITDHEGHTMARLTAAEV
jgi:hypothetical protein